jgi:HK97 family phage major capsid protein
MIEADPNATYSLEARQRGVSFIKDLLSAASGGDSVEARNRLAQHRQETRDVAGLNTVVGNAEGFSFAPPQYDLLRYAEFARAAAPLYHLLPKQPLLGPVVKVPKLTAGSTAAEQSSENTTITTSEFSDEYLTTTAKTVAAATAVSQQLIELSAVSIDQIVFTDMFKALFQEIDYALWYDANFGLDTLVQTTYNLPTFNETDIPDLLGGLAKAIEFIETTRYLPPTAIFCHPSVKNHLIARTDTTNRPLVTPQDVSYNPVATYSDGPSIPGGEGLQSLRLLGLPVFTDPNIAVSNNTSALYVVRMEDNILYTNGPEALASPYPLAAQLSWFLRLHQFIAPVWRFPEASIVKVGNYNSAPAYGS